MSSGFTPARRILRVWSAVAAFAFSWQAMTPAHADEPPAPRHMMAQGYYFREPTDRAWTLKITGTIPSLPGIYLILHDATGKLLYKGTVDYGEHTAQNPFVVNFPPDNITGDYKLNIFGQQNDFLGLDLPMSDLPFETYGGIWLSFGFDKTPVPFRARAGAKNVLGMRAYNGYLKILDDQMQVVADYRAGIGRMTPGESNKDFYNKVYNPIEFPFDPKRLYWLTGDTFYIEPRQELFFSFDPKKIFEPDPRLETIKWWEL